MVQQKVVLGIAVLLRAARNEHVVVAEEVLQTNNLEGGMEGDRKRTRENEYVKLDIFALSETIIIIAR